MVGKSLTDTFADLMGEIIGDIRDKLIDEAWFGRPVNNRTELAFYENLWLQEGGPDRPDIDRKPGGIHGEIAPSTESGSLENARTRDPERAINDIRARTLAEAWPGKARPEDSPSYEKLLRGWGMEEPSRDANLPREREGPDHDIDR